MLKDKSKNVFESGMHIDSALNCVTEAAYILGRENGLPDSVFSNLSAARNGLELALDALDQMPDGPTFDLHPAIAAAAEHEVLIAEVKAHNLRLTQQANAMVEEVTDSLIKLFAHHNLPIAVSRKFESRDGLFYVQKHYIEAVCRNNYSTIIIEVTLYGENQYELRNGRKAPRHKEVRLTHRGGSYNSLNDCLKGNPEMLTTLIIESKK